MLQFYFTYEEAWFTLIKYIGLWKSGFENEIFWCQGIFEHEVWFQKGL